MAALDVDGRQEYLSTSCLAGTLHHLIAVLGKLLAIQVAVGVYVIEIRQWELFITV